MVALSILLHTWSNSLLSPRGCPIYAGTVETKEIQRLWNAIFFFVLFSPGELVDYFELLSADLVLFGFTNLTHTHKVNNKIKTESVLKTDM